MIEWRSYHNTAGMLADMFRNFAIRISGMRGRRGSRVRAVFGRIAHLYDLISTGQRVTLDPQEKLVLGADPTHAIDALEETDLWGIVASSISLIRSLGTTKRDPELDAIAAVEIRWVIYKLHNFVPTSELHQIEGNWRAIDLGLTGKRVAAFIVAWEVDPESAVELAKEWSEDRP